MLPPIEKFASGEIKTLGFGVLDWCSRYLVNPDSRGGVKGATWVFQPDQIHFILAFYAVDDNGDWLYMTGYRERAKGSGKSPMVAAIACAEYLGPVVFSHFDSGGNAVGKPNPDSMIWIAGVSWSAIQHTYRYIRGMLAGPAADAYNLSVGATRVEVRANASRRIDAITSTSSANEGGTPTFAICEETQHWLPGDHHDDLYETIVQSVAKVSGRIVQVTNTPMPGEGSVAEKMHLLREMVERGDSDDDLLFDTFGIEIEDIYDVDQAIPALETVYKDAPWVKVMDIFRQYSQPAYREFKARRFFFNQMIRPEALWISKGTWSAAERSKLKLRKSDLISIGFRFRNYCAAIVAVRLKDQALFVLEKWERPSSAGRDWEVPYKKVDDEMRRILDRYNVYNVVASPQNVEEIVGRWTADYDGDVVIEGLWLRSKQKWADSVEMFDTAVATRRLKHDGDPDLARHIANCFVDEIPQGRIIRPITDNSNRYIVIAEAAVLAMRAYAEAVEDGALDDPPDNTLSSF